jgi:hypothetical protein
MDVMFRQQANVYFELRRRWPAQKRLGMWHVADSQTRWPTLGGGGEKKIRKWGRNMGNKHKQIK